MFLSSHDDNTQDLLTEVGSDIPLDAVLNVLEPLVSKVTLLNNNNNNNNSDLGVSVGGKDWSSSLFARCHHKTKGRPYSRYAGD